MLILTLKPLTRQALIATFWNFRIASSWNYNSITTEESCAMMFYDIIRGECPLLEYFENIFGLYLVFKKSKMKTTSIFLVNHISHENYHYARSVSQSENTYCRYKTNQFICSTMAPSWFIPRMFASISIY